MKQNVGKKKDRQKKKETAGKLLFRVFLFQVVLIFCSSSCVDSPQTQSPVNNVEKEEEVFVEPIIEKAKNPKTALELYLDSLGLQDVQEFAPSVRVDLKYSTIDNFTGKVLYGELNRAYLHPLAMGKLIEAQKLLEQNNPDLYLLVYDAARPVSVQKEMYDAVKNTPYKVYVASPERTSLHNYGMAVDITICDKDTIPLDMGTGFDYFGSKAGTNQEELLIQQGKLTRQQVDNRLLLSKVMKEAGFVPIRGEWWHFNACNLSEAKRVADVIK